MPQDFYTVLYIPISVIDTNLQINNTQSPFLINIFPNTTTIFSLERIRNHTYRS